MFRSNKVSLSVDIDENINCILISSKSGFDPNFPKHLLWEQQRKQCQLKSKKSMRWHPLMIKWWFSIHLKSPGQQLVCFFWFVTIYSSLLACSFGLDKFIYINEYVSDFLCLCVLWKSKFSCISGTYIDNSSI